MKNKFIAFGLFLASSLVINVASSANLEAGKAIASKACAACHGADFNSPADPSYPKLAGQHKDYLVHALTAYKRGDGPNGRSNAIMSGQAKALSKEDIENVAAYLHSLPGSLVLRK